MNVRIKRKELLPMERHEMMKEIKKEVMKADDQYWRNISACTLYAIHEYTAMKGDGWGKKRILEFYDFFTKKHAELKERYASSDADEVSDNALYLLEQIGISVDGLIDK